MFGPNANETLFMCVIIFVVIMAIGWAIRLSGFLKPLNTWLSSVFKPRFKRCLCFLLDHSWVRAPAGYGYEAGTNWICKRCGHKAKVLPDTFPSQMRLWVTGIVVLLIILAAVGVTIARTKGHL